MLVPCPDRKIKIRNTLSSLLSALLLASIVSNELMATEVAGVLPGELSVTQTGAAKYTIPLAVIPGTAGMQPSLSLSYNSQSGSGMLGRGWSLNGLSSITRCGRTIVQDGVKGGVGFNDNDRFCLDGQRLVAVSGEYGQDGTEYRTENDSFARVYSYGRKGHGPAWFKVQAKSGQTLEYGNTNDSRIEAQGKSEVYVWAQNKISDAVGNYLTVSYHENNASSEYYPTRIDYAGNVNAGTKTTNSIRFEYTDKIFSIGGYNGGSFFKSSKNLIAINTWHLETKVSEFRFEYEEPEFKSAMLTSIKQCDGNGKCLFPTTFEWLKSTFGDVGARLDAENEWGNDASEEYTRTKTGEGWTQYFADMNEDGLPGVVMGYVGKLGAKVKVAYNVGDRIGGIKHKCSRGSMNYQRTEKGEGWSHSFMDMNGDGRLDYVMKYFGKNGSRVDVGINRSGHCGVYSKWEIITDDEYLRTDTGEGWSQHLIDMNGDGLPDHVMSYFGSLGTKIKVSLNTGSGLEPQTEWERTGNVSYSRNYKGEGWGQYLIDMNADGLPDHVMGYFGENGSIIDVALNTGNGFSRSERWEITKGIKYTRTDTGDGWSQYFADINGDNLPDNVMGYLGRNGVKVRVAFNNGDGFDSASYWVDSKGIYTSYITGGRWSQSFQDLNGDGLPEHILTYMGKTGGTSKVAMNKGHGFGSSLNWYRHSNEELIRTETGEGWSQGFIDMNRDGVIDHVLSYSGKEGSKISVSLNKEKSFSGLKTIVNSLGVETEIKYKTLSDEEVYTKGSDGIYPLIDLSPPINVVSDVSVDNGVGGEDKASYRYKAMKGHITGRGILGFGEVDKTDHLTGLVTTTQYLQEFPYTGVVSSTQQRLNNGVMLTQVVNTWEVMTGDKEGIYYPYNSKSVSERYELDGSHISTTTQEEVLDDFGNATNIKVVVSGDSETYTKESVNKYINDTDLWHLGRLTRASVKHTNTEGSITKTSAFEYNSNGLLSKEIIEPDDWALSLETDYTYDLFGNKTVSTTHGHGVESRTTTTAYTPDGRFPFSLTNALGHTETYTYDLLHGRVISQTGPNGLTTHWSYDSFGRKTHEERADGTWSSIERGFCQIEGCPSNTPANAAMYTVTQSAGSPPVTTYADKLGRELVILKTGFNGQSIHQETQYNEFGQVARTLSPYSPSASDAIKLEHWIEYEYDVLGRVLNTTNASNVVNFTYQGLITITTDLLGHKKRTTHNLQGEIARVEEEENTWVEYKYDPTGNLIETNSNGAITRITYDLRGRKIAMDDPSMGSWKYRYNALGELIEQRDANGHLTELAYDVLGRKVKRIEPEGTTTWQYDSADYGIGKLYKVTGPDGYVEVYTYDELGRAKRTEQHTVDGVLSHQLEYDDYGRVTKEIRPAGFVVLKKYNEYGYLESILSPKDHVNDYSWSHLEGVLEVATLTAEKAYDKAIFYSDKAAEYRAEASRYALIADIYRNKGNAEEIETLRSASETLEDYANKLQSHADQYKSQADQSIQIANKHKRYAKNKRLIGFIYRWLSDAYNRQAKRYSDQYDKYRLLAEESLAYLQGDRDDLDLKTASLIEIAEYYVQRSENQIDQSNASQDKSKYYTLIANELASGKVFDGADFYQAMMDDGEEGFVTFWRALERDDHGRLTKYVHGNGLITRDIYGLFTGQLYHTKTGFSHENDIRSISYKYDANNNVIERSNSKIFLVESFEYDRLDRLVRANVNGNLSGISYEYGMSLAYHAHGNITHKSDIGNYTYDMNRPQLLVGVGDDDYHYDASGNILKGGDREFEWASFNKPTQLKNGEVSVRFDYDANHNRYRKHTEVNGEAVITNYFGKFYEKEVQGNKIRHKHHIYADGKLVAIHIKSEELDESLPDETRYLHYYALGSVDTITDGEGNVVDRIVYDPWGKRLGGDWLIDDPLNSTQLIISRFTKRGFTGHEHIDELNLIHMNGRVYDPKLGRFLSADPTMQFPYSTQGYNRYAYVQNSPLKYTDPSGYGLFGFVKKIFRAVTKVVKKVAKAVVKVVKKVLKPVVRVVKEAVFDVTKKILQSKHGRVIAAIATAAFGGHLVYAATSSAVAAGAAGGFAGGLIGSGGDLKAGVIGGITGGLAGYIGSSAFDSIKGITAQRVVAHGVVGGVASEAQGGKFIHGFVSSGFTKSVSGHIQSSTNSDPLAGGIASAVVGGTASELAGGKFANGAMTNAFQYMFNQVATVGVSVRVPTWVRKIYGFFGGNESEFPNSMSYGLAISTPKYVNGKGLVGEYDVGAYAEASIDAVDIGLGRISADVTYDSKAGFLRDTAGVGYEAHAHAGAYGLSVQGNESGVTGWGMHVGPGASIGMHGQYREIYSLRHRTVFDGR